MLKILWKYFPVSLKKYLFPSSIVLSVASTFIYLFVTGQSISFSFPALLQLVIAFVIYLIVVVFVGLFISYNRIILYLYYSKNEYKTDSIDSTSKKVESKKEKKRIPYQFELEVLNHSLIEYTVFIKRKWLPNESKPGIESFIEEIGFSEPRCGKCHNDFYKHYGSTDYFDCTNPECDNKQKFWSSDIYTVNQQLQIRFKGRVRNNYDEYWNKYKKIYDDFTNKNYEEYFDPVR